MSEFQKAIDWPAGKPWAGAGKGSERRPYNPRIFAANHAEIAWSPRKPFGKFRKVYGNPRPS